MSEGVFAVHRGVFKHPIFANEPYTEREAWLWIVGNAVWKSSRVRVKDTVFDLVRGQCAYSIRFLAVQWKWSKSRTARFLELLKNERMIDTQAGRDATRITVCKYNDYQLTPGHSRDADGDAGGTQAGRRRDKEEELNNLIKERPLSEKRSDARKQSRNGYPKEFEEFWTAYPTDRLMGKKETYDAWKRMAPEDCAAAHSAVPAFVEYCRKNPDYRPIHAVRFLSKRRFDGFAKTELDRQAELKSEADMRARGYEWHEGKWQKSEAA